MLVLGGGDGVGCGGKGGSGEGVSGKGGLRVVRWRRIGTECSRLECGGRDLREIRWAGVRIGVIIRVIIRVNWGYN